MDKIYLDNASTTYPKPEVVAESMHHYMTNLGTNIHRGNYQSAYDAASVVFDTRQRVAALFGGERKNVVFTKNVTESLNVLLKGFLKPGDHILVSAMEHNAMMRPLPTEVWAPFRLERCDSPSGGTTILHRQNECFLLWSVAAETTFFHVP